MYGKFGVLIMIKKLFLFSVKEIEVNFFRIVVIECKVNINEFLYIVGVYFFLENNIEVYKD